jgi:hypothetical protein
MYMLNATHVFNTWTTASTWMWEMRRGVASGWFEQYLGPGPGARDAAVQGRHGHCQGAGHGTRSGVHLCMQDPLAPVGQNAMAFRPMGRQTDTHLTSDCHNFGWWMDWLDAHSVSTHVTGVMASSQIIHNSPGGGGAYFSSTGRCLKLLHKIC